MQDPKSLKVWHLARAIALAVIEALPERASRKVPGLRSQAIRAANSVHANLAEGCRRATRPEFLHFVEIALGSQSELDTHLELARHAGILPADRHIQIQRDTDLARRMLFALIRAVEQRIADDESRRSAPKPSDPPSTHDEY